MLETSVWAVCQMGKWINLSDTGCLARLSQKVVSLGHGGRITDRHGAPNADSDTNRHGEFAPSDVSFRGE